MGLQPVDLLADVGLGGEERRFHVEPRLVERGGRLEQQPHLFGQALADLRRLARWIRFGLQGQRLDGCDVIRQKRAQRLALGLARLDQTGEALFQAIHDHRVDRRPLLFRLDRLGHVEHAAQGKQSVGAGGGRAILLDKAGGKLGHVAQEIFVDDRLHHSAGRAADGQGRLHIAARKALLDRLPDRRFEALEALRQAQAHVDALAVDRLHLPGDRRSLVLGGHAGEACHAL
jgi:hypothetical protein